MYLYLFLANSADIATKAVGGEASLTAQAVIGVLVSGIGWFIKTYLGDLKKAIESASSAEIAKMEEVRAEMKTARIAVDLNTRSVTVAVLGIAALIPGSKPILEEAKASADARLKAEGI